MKPRKNFRSRPKKSGAKKRQRLLSQKKRVIAGGHDKESVDKMTSLKIRQLVAETAKKKSKKAMAKKAAPKKKAATKKPAAKKAAPKKAPAKKTTKKD